MDLLCAYRNYTGTRSRPQMMRQMHHPTVLRDFLRARLPLIISFHIKPKRTYHRNRISRSVPAITCESFNPGYNARTVSAGGTDSEPTIERNWPARYAERLDILYVKRVPSSSIFT